MLKKWFSLLIVVFAFTMYGCATTGTVDEKESIKSDCAPNFSIEGSAASGKVYSAFKDYPNKSKEEAFDRVISTVSMKLKGWQVINGDKNTGLISASRGVIGSNKKSAMNIMVKRINKKDVRVEISRKVDSFMITSTDGIIQVFCQIFNSI